MKILLIEDDPRISDFLTQGLSENQHLVTLVQSAEKAQAQLTTKDWDIILLDVMLPGINGIEFTKLIRFKQMQTPILILSALGSVEDKIKALNAGADDYLVKPFHFKELLSRINALHRRYQNKYDENTNIKDIGHLKIDKDKYAVYSFDKLVDLSPTEYKLLIYLVDNAQKVLSRSQILNAVWDIHFQNNTNVVDVYISYLRAKLETPEHKLIQTVKGVGYMIKD